MPQQSLVDKAKKAFNDAKEAISSTGKEYSGLGNELGAVRQNVDDYKASTNPPQKKPVGPVASPKDKVGMGPYGSRPGEKRIDTTDMTKPLGSFAKGTDSVPKTGVYKVHEGEKIVPAKDNNMEHSPAEKAHFHRAMSHLHTGALHRHFGIAEDQPIPMEKKQEAANSDNPHVAAMGRMAVAMHGWSHKKK